MAVRYDPLLAAAVAAELEERYAGEAVAALGLHTDAWTAALAFADGSVLWVFLHPEAGQIVPGDRSPLAPRLASRAAWTKAVRRGLIRNDGWRWHVFRNLAAASIRSLPDERLVLVTLTAGPTAEVGVLLDLPRNRRNVLLLEPDDPPRWRIRAALRSRHARPGIGGLWEPPSGRRAGVEPPLSCAEWEGVLAQASPEGKRGAALRGIAFTSALNVDYILAGSSHRDTGAEAFARYVNVCQAAERRLLQRPWGLQPYVHSLGDEAAAPLDSLLDGMRRAAEEGGVREPPADATQPATDGEGVAAALRRRRRRLGRRLAALREQLKAGDAAERLRETGHLLLARLRDVPRGSATVELIDFDGSPRRIALDPALGPAENADRYYRRAARRERALERLPAMIADVRRQLQAVEAGLKRLAEGEEADAALRELARLPALPSPVEGNRTAVESPGPAERLPYHRYRSAGGLEIRVGRSSRDNDALTFHHAASEDIWLHARQVPGAHVVLRWGRRDQNPPERDLREAAVLAAVHSNARGSAVVAVDWTRRKYVRKPRRAAPGVVSAERLRTLFVEPDRNAARRRRADP